MPKTLQKLVATALERAIQGAAAAFVAPTQLGIAVPNGCERILHEIDAALAKHPDYGAVHLEFVNAFNLVSRAAAMEVIQRAFPPLVPYFKRLYGPPLRPTDSKRSHPTVRAPTSRHASPSMWSGEPSRATRWEPCSPPRPYTSCSVACGGRRET